jgi:hypothetical protein
VGWFDTKIPVLSFETVNTTCLNNSALDKKFKWFTKVGGRVSESLVDLPSFTASSSVGTNHQNIYMPGKGCEWSDTIKLLNQGKSEIISLRISIYEYKGDIFHDGPDFAEKRLLHQKLLQRMRQMRKSINIG